MSNHGFHVHGPHDHAVEHAAHQNDSFASQIAVMTAVLSTLGAVFSYAGGATQNAALMHKNEASITKTEAADQWAFYQAKGNKQALAELGAALTTENERREKFLKEAERYKSEKESIKTKAEGLEKKVEDEEKLSEAALHQHHRWAQSMTAIQVAISLAAITLLTRKKWLEYMAGGAALIGLALAAAAALHY